MSVNDPRVRLRHMLDAAEEVIAFSEGHIRSDLDTNQMLLRALSMSIGIIGEAASQLPDELQASYAAIPWRQIIGMRNFLFHEYFRVDPDILWETAIKAVPPLVAQIKQMLADTDDNSATRM